jgi:dihydroflavonol-4-reductase
MSDSNSVKGRVLVTGSSGLLGRELISQLLAKGKLVTALYNKKKFEGPASENLKLLQCDILDVTGLEEAMEGVEELYHCAGKVSFNGSDAGALFKVNVEGTANVVNAALEAGVRKMVHVSSVAALGRIRKDEMIDESMQWTEETSNSKYGQSKYLGELEVWRGIAEGLNAVIVNPTIILGVGDHDESSTKIFKSVYNEFPWYSEGVTGFVDVADVAKAMIQLMESEIVSERFIISAENRTYREVFNSMADAFGKKRPTKKVTAWLASVVWRLERIKSKFTGKQPLVTKETAATALAIAVYDNSKLKKYLPSFEYLNLEQTIKSTCSVLQQKLNIQ